MKILLTFFVLLFSSSVFAEEWTFEDLDEVFNGCVDEAKEMSLENEFNLNISSYYEYCGCYVNGIAKNFELTKILKMMESGILDSDKTFNSIVEGCAEKIGII